ncbi:hypothetical protein BUALT_Bualt02G0219700 [Buddleja alternifolia]|uniref:Uncharacterized protein n=1 Tax=Buddleja alternifolia TaxID=168488 RepID=A0AAV6Y2A0_9LAMI|nr:hypothetical protein BUALT_Bualt02G0219700 [Buddleja alternifolia]
MDIEGSKQDDGLALGKASKISKLETDSLTDALKELDMDRYDEEDDGNFIAVGSMEPAIQIWDLDMMDESSHLLASLRRRKRGRRLASLVIPFLSLDLYYTELAELEWLLATGSMDKMVKTWDLLDQPSCIASKNPKAVCYFFSL